ncbi:hypothetical protein ACWEKT_24580 [Nocardia takedensis]|nr:hypothetical protein [Nocardia takedensis]
MSAPDIDRTDPEPRPAPPEPRRPVRPIRLGGILLGQLVLGQTRPRTD